MGLDQWATMPDGSKVLVEGEAQDIVGRIKNGDPSKGWEGDRSMRVFVVEQDGYVVNGKTPGDMRPASRCVFEVWGIDRTGEPYLAIESETCGPELIDKLIRADTRRRDVVEDAIKAQERAQADILQKQQEHHEEMADRMAFALQSDNAAHFGGKGRLITVNDSKDRQ